MVELSCSSFLEAVLLETENYYIAIADRVRSHYRQTVMGAL